MLPVSPWPEYFVGPNSGKSIPGYRTSSNTISMESARENIEFQLENKNYLMMPDKNPGTWQILQLMPDGSLKKLGSAVKTEDEKVKESKEPIQTKKQKIEPAIKSPEVQDEKIEKVASAEETPVQAITQVVKQSLKIGKVVGSRYEAYKKADRIGRIQIVKDLIFGASKKQTNKEEIPQAFKIGIFQNETQLEIYTNQYPLQLEALDENGDLILNLGNVKGNYAEIAISDIPEGPTWIKFSKDGQLKIIKYK
ncbi:MAG: hypothetical protein R2769_11875 [Saprospiraceae bacterium]